jgi:hypothetical protein
VVKTSWISEKYDCFLCRQGVHPEYVYLNFISRAKRADPERVLFSSSLPLLGHAQGSILERRCASRKLSENDMAWLHIIFRYSRAFNSL